MQTTGFENGQHGVVGEWVDGTGVAHSPPVEFEFVADLGGGALALVERGDVDTEPIGCVNHRFQLAVHPFEFGCGRHPLTQGRLDTLAGQQLELIDIDPPALAHNTLERAVGRSVASASHRCDVEDLTTADGLGST